MRGLFVAGTDTGVGKTMLSAALVAAMASRGLLVRAHKPVLTGLDEPARDWPRDDELLATACGMDRDEVAPLRYGPAVSPHLAAELAGRPIAPGRLVANARAAADGATLVVEGTGGLLVPLCASFCVADLALALGLPLVIAARAGLGTINHTLLTLAAARAAGLEVRAVVLTPWPRDAGALERSNRDTIAALGKVDVHGLAPIDRPLPQALARAARALPWRRWLRASADHDLADAATGRAADGPPAAASIARDTWASSSSSITNGGIA
jgi:dethiobiotin synthetase